MLITSGRHSLLISAGKWG